MALNFGSFMGGAADGYRKQNEDLRRQSEEKRVQDAADREAAWQKEVSALDTGQQEKAAKTAQMQGSRLLTNAMVSQTIKNPIASQGLNMPPSSFAEDTAQRSAENPAAPSNIAANGIGNAVDAELARPEQKEQPKAPAGLADTLDLITKRAAIDMKYGKMNGAGAMQLLHVRQQLENEGTKNALLKFHSGNVQGGIDEFNQNGSRRAKLISSEKVDTEVGGVKMPTTLVTMEDENGNRQTINAAHALYSMVGMEKQLDIMINARKEAQTEKHHTETLAQTSKHQDETETETKRHNIASEDIYRTKAQNSGGITLPQQRTNYEIESARKYIANLSPQVIQKRTQQYSATGRENPDYDPTLAAKVRQANHRKYGEDEDFAAISTPPMNNGLPDISANFSADLSMKGHRLGNKTPQGFEVLDANGKLIGHYN